MRRPRKWGSELLNGGSCGNRTSQMWLKPKQHFIKSNWDTSLSKQNMGLGIVLRNENGEVLACACYKKNQFVILFWQKLWHFGIQLSCVMTLASIEQS